MIFSTSAGRLVFNAYKDRPQLPEDVARANGHHNLAQYLQDVNARLVDDHCCSLPDYLIIIRRAVMDDEEKNIIIIQQPIYFTITKIKIANLV